MMTSTFVAKLDFITRITNICTQKIDGSPLVIHEIVLVGFSVQDKLGKVWFFEKTFLLADTSIKVVLRMPFLIFFDANI